ncbi:MAG: RagB/SusD family nutrient uptake outer membrane protein [Mucilaginibacter sp.]
MKKFNLKIGAVAGVFIMSIALYACKKSFLDKPALGSLSQATLSTSAGVNGLLIGAYSLVDGFGGAGGGWQSSGTNWVYGNVAADDAYKGSDPGDQGDIVPIETYTSTAANGYFNQKWQAVYDGIQRANEVLRVMANAKDMTDAQKTEVRAEARFLRGHYHFEAKKMWNNAPYVDESVTYAASNFNVPNDKDIWPNIEADFQYAFANLPATQKSVGRANKYAAEAYLAKAYMFEHKYSQAQPLLDDLISNGTTSNGLKYKLDTKFFDNFDAATKNSAEAIFSMQQSVNDGSNGNNGGWGDVLNFPYNGGPGGCCGFDQPSQSLVNSFQVDAAGLPLLDTWNNTDVKSDQGLKSSDPFTPTTQALDPRLDMTVGRRGIPYLDWGLHPGQNWVRDQNNGGPYAPIKHVYRKSQEGALTDKSFWTNGVTANNYTFIRFADVLLWRAEAAVELGDLSTALTMVNMVRARAADPATWVHTYVDNNDPSKGFTNTPAANYQIGLYPAFPDAVYARKAVQFERKLELAMEGHRFFDLVRYGTADVVLNAYIAKEKAQRTFFSGASFTKGKNEYFPIPQAQIDLEHGKLKQNPGY